MQSYIKSVTLVASRRLQGPLLAPRRFLSLTISEDLDDIVHISNKPFIPKSNEEYQALKKSQIVQPDPQRARSLVVSIVGEPNAGKSTLLNRLVKHEISCVSERAHTTRKNTIGICVRNDTQIVLSDTPGIVTKKHVLKHSLESHFISDPRSSVNQADLIAVLVDVSNKERRTRINPGILGYLRQNISKKSILILNKIDRIREKRKLLDIGTHLTRGLVDGKRSYLSLHHKSSNSDPGGHDFFSEDGWPLFSRLFMISALENSGLNELEDYLLGVAIPGRPWTYPQNMVTDATTDQIITDMVRSRLLDILEDELPYKISVKLSEWDVDELGNIRISVTVFTPKRLIPPVIGLRGERVKRVSQETKESLQQLLKCNIIFKLIVTPTKKK